ncbi:hypothetical protein PACTADRAFT_1372 [Pachysolen tannophilus NRRL Y-2460]|uniref:EXS domain-containing protein n=1 Tax=Pachysolen tannophilus NRRL Y-2460 TaxID=669874 RepID=A0A1E4TYP1_PACTA|nr:hypothetical protein PACTADRAFT_1372 [Pachysolen tannophilus NRRL Y-2460]
MSLTSFDIFLPLPFRILFLVTLATWLWAINLKICYDHNIDTFQVLKLQPSQPVNASTNFYKKPIKVSSITILNYIIYLTFKNLYLSDVGNGITILDCFSYFNLILIFATLILPINKSPSNLRLYQTFKRILFFGKIDINLRNNDILLADTFTSYSKILVDLHVLNCNFIKNKTLLPNLSKDENTLDRSIGSVYCTDLIIGCIPSTIRLKQCLYEYSETKKIQHLLNAIKYSTNYLPMFATIYMRQNNNDGILFWYAFSFINSFYSFVWDVMVDWNFEFFHYVLSADRRQKYLLRSILMYNVSFYYHVSIMVDFILRFIWVLRMFSNPDSKYLLLRSFDSEGGLFLLEILEILRRWIWVFIKIETEYIKMFNGDINKLRDIDEDKGTIEMDSYNKKY